MSAFIAVPSSPSCSPSLFSTPYRHRCVHPPTPTTRCSLTSDSGSNLNSNSDSDSDPSPPSRPPPGDPTGTGPTHQHTPSLPSDQWRSFRARLIRTETDNPALSPIQNYLLDPPLDPSTSDVNVDVNVDADSNNPPCTTTPPSSSSPSSSSSSSSTPNTTHTQSSTTSLWAHPVSFIEPGSLLLSSPSHFMRGHAATFFANTAILILHHGDDEGTLGVILNRPLPTPTSTTTTNNYTTTTTPFQPFASSSSSLSSDDEDYSNSTQSIDVDELFACDDPPVFLGGPVGLETLGVLHGDDNFGHPVTGAVRSASFAQALGRFKEGNLPHARFFLGYTGWRKGQLQNEIDHGVWLNCSACDELVLRRWKGGTELHRTVLPLMGEAYDELVNGLGGGE